MVDARPKASPKEVREFFETGDARKVSSAELMALKKTKDGETLPDYDQIAYGIGDGTYNY